MSTHKHIDIICIIITVIAVVLTVLFINGKALGITPMPSEENDENMFTANDMNADHDFSSATKITLKGDSVSVSGNGAYAEGSEVHIAYAGSYELSGSLGNGRIIIDADGDDKIWLSLNGASLYCEDGPALYIEQADKVFITLKEGTENEISCGALCTDEKLDGAIYSRDDLTINGSGSLTVNGSYKHGLVCNDDLAICGGNIGITAVKDTIHAHDSIRLCNASLTLNAGDDAMTASNDADDSFIYIESGNINILSCYEGIEAVYITVAGGDITVNCTDDGINANNDSKSLIKIDGGIIRIINEHGIDADGFD